MRKAGKDGAVYAWCSESPRSAGVPPLPAQEPIPVLLDPDAPGTPALPLAGVDAAGRDEALAGIAHPRIRMVPAYWHAGWEHARPEPSLRESAVSRLVQAAQSLPDGFGLAIWDGWRDPRLQAALYEAAYADPHLPPGFVNPPLTDPATPPPHATGGTVDLTLTWRNRPLSLGTGFDEFVPRARARSLEDAGDDAELAQDRDLRRLLRTAMTGAGYVQLASEWWHFEYGTRLWAAVHAIRPLYPATSPPPQTPAVWSI